MSTKNANPWQQSNQKKQMHRGLEIGLSVLREEEVEVAVAVDRQWTLTDRNLFLRSVLRLMEVSASRVMIYGVSPKLA